MMCFDESTLHPIAISSHTVIPVKTGIQYWIPACAGMTER